jgi:Ca2+-binding RTX toxin-like protein
VALSGVGSGSDVDIASSVFVNNTAGVLIEDAGSYASDADLAISRNQFTVPTSAAGVDTDTNDFTDSDTFTTNLGDSLKFNTFTTNITDGGSDDSSSVAIESTDFTDFDDLIIEGTSSGGETVVFDEPNAALTIDLTNTGQVDFDNDGSNDGEFVTGTLNNTNVYLSSTSGDSDIENVTGTDFGDTITGDEQANVLSGGAGDDRINGGGGNDEINGGDGDDDLDGGAGNDTFDGGAGNDTILGGADNDTYNANRVDGTINSFVGGSGDDTAVFSGDTADYFINRADHLLDNIGDQSGGSGSFTDEFFDGGSGATTGDGAEIPPELDGVAWDASQPIFQIDYVQNGIRQTDY